MKEDGFGGHRRGGGLGGGQKSVTSGGRKRKGKGRDEGDEKFVRNPMFDEIQKLAASQKLLGDTDWASVGWENMNSTRDPATGQYLGNPQY